MIANSTVNPKGHVLFSVMMLRGGAGWARVWAESDDDPSLKDVTLGLHIEFLRDGEMVCWSDPCIDSQGRGGMYASLLYGDVDAMKGLKLGDPRWTVRVRGNAGAALKDEDVKSYWQGEFTDSLSRLAKEVD